MNFYLTIYGLTHQSALIISAVHGTRQLGLRVHYIPGYFDIVQQMTLRQVCCLVLITVKETCAQAVDV